MIFNLLIATYHAVKFGKNLSRQACVILGQNSVKMSYLAQNRIFCDILFKWNLPIYCGLSCWKVKKISLEQILREACINLEHNWDKITHLAQKINFLEITFKLFYLFIMLYHAANFRNNLQQKSWHKRLHDYGPRLCQNCPCGKKQDFLGKLTELIFLFLFCPFMSQGWKWNR